MKAALNHCDRLPVLILDTTGFCNLRCKMCPQSAEAGTGPERGVMGFSLYRKIIDELASAEGLKADAVLPFWNGEALLHPEFCTLVDYAARSRKTVRGFNVFSLHTNFLLADSEKIETIVDSGIFGPITVSVDASTADTYTLIRRGGDFEKLAENIHRFLAYRKKRNLSQPSLVLQFIVMKENLAEAADFLRLWQGIFHSHACDPQVVFEDNADFSHDTVSFRLLQTGNPELQAGARDMHNQVRGLLGSRGNLRHATGEAVSAELCSGSRPPCVVLWQQLGVRYDGRVSACCRDVGAVMNLGDAREKNLRDIFWGDQLRDLREAHISGRFSDFPLCLNCVDQTAHRLSHGDVKTYLTEIGSRNLFRVYQRRMRGSKAGLQNNVPGLHCDNDIRGKGNPMHSLKSIYDQFLSDEREESFLTLAIRLVTKRRFRTLLILHRHHRVKHLKVYACLAFAHQELGDFRRARRLYYKLARKLDKRYWESLAFCLRQEKKYLLSAFSYVMAMLHTGRHRLLKSAAYSAMMAVREWEQVRGNG
ncbi:MAG: radical SAM protein [Candidatus Wallbacteria bacterium]|nr:radical SAM protein [Candidatus Wallbacteria bacterium]